MRALLSVSFLSTFLLLFATRVQLASALESSRDTTLATYNAGLLVGTIGNIDARVTVLIDQVYTGLRSYKQKLIMPCTVFVCIIEVPFSEIRPRDSCDLVSQASRIFPHARKILRGREERKNTSGNSCQVFVSSWNVSATPLSHDTSDPPTRPYAARPRARTADVLHNTHGCIFTA